MDYRNDLEASRLRINTLEAKLEESKASLEAREAELAECKVERDRLRQTGAAKPAPSRWYLLNVAVISFVLGTGFGAGFGLMISRPAEAVVQPAAPLATVTEDGPKAEGRANVPPPAPRPPPATDQGRAAVPKEEPRPPTASIAGQTGSEGSTEPDAAPAVTITGHTGLDEDTKSITSVIDAARPKVRDCYQAQAKSKPDAAGSLKVIFDIDAKGRVSDVKIKPISAYSQPWWDKNFETCVGAAYRKLEFPSSSSSRTTAEANYFLSALDLRR